ncbi:MAG TPA: glycoside hydrolase family 28 protein [Opitutaceae bacterium]
MISLLARGAEGPPGIHDVKAYGAVGDGRTNDTAAINEAIASAEKAGGGTVVFPPGTYLSGSIHLKNNIELHLSAGATIEASGEGQAYDAPEENEWGDAFVYQDAGHSHWHDSLIWGEDLNGVTISGPGRIYGQGLSRGHSSDHVPQKIGNKAIALKNCRNVTLRGFTIEHGGWFGILATGVDNLTIDGLVIDTNRDGMDIDCCRDVHIANCSVNSPWDDGICLKSSFGLGQFRATENVTISDCLVSGYDEGTLLDGTRKHSADNPAPNGRIKFGTESNGGFKAIAITNCIFECSRGLALETVDGALLEDVTISNLTMRHIFGAPIFIRLGGRMRGPPDTPIGAVRMVSISDVQADDVVDGQGILISGLPGHPVTGITLHDIRIAFAGGGTAAQAGREVPELERDYPEPGSFGITPAWGMFVRHARDISVQHLDLRTKASDLRPSVQLDDVAGATFEHLNAVPAPAAKTFVLRKVSSFSAHGCPGVPDSVREKPVEQEQL